MTSPSRLPKAGQEQRRNAHWMTAGMPAEKSLNFGPSIRRLLRMLRPERLKLGVVLLLALIAVGLAVLGPRILGRATDVIFCRGDRASDPGRGHRGGSHRGCEG